MPDDPAARQEQSRINWILIAFLGIAAFYLITEHTAHLLGALPYLILLACPVLHFFMHRGHGGHAGHGGHHGSREEDKNE